MVYPIWDRSFLPDVADQRHRVLERLGRELADADIALLEYRNKVGSDVEVLREAEILRSVLAVGRVRLVLDDRVDVAMAARFDGVHVDQGDLPAGEARKLMGSAALLGTSASDEGALQAALGLPVDYVAFGPVFRTTTKQTAVEPIGLEGVRRFRAEAGREAVLVAAAGITLSTAPQILAAGASVVAVSAAIFGAQDPAAEFRRWVDALA